MNRFSAPYDEQDENLKIIQNAEVFHQTNMAEFAGLTPEEINERLYGDEEF